MFSDNDNQLDAMLAQTEDMPAMEEPQTEDRADTILTDGGETEPQSAGQQPDAKDGDAQEDKQTNDAKAKTAPMGVVAELRQQKRELRQQLRPLYDRLRDLESENEELRRRVQSPAEQTEDDEDDDVPLTKADLRRIERERTEAERTRIEQEQSRRVHRQLQLASPEQKRLLVLAEPYLSRRDREQIARAEDPLTLAVKLGTDRVDIFGTEEEIAEIDRLIPSQQKTSSESQQDTSSPRASRDAKAAPAAQDSGVRNWGDDVAPHNRELLDYMFG